MVKIRTKYIILIWILLLILFTFYCIFRIKYISNKIQEKYANLPKPTPTKSNIIDWINNINKTSKLTDSAGCEYVYDDNIGVAILGYSDCKSANDDYINKGFDVNNKFGQSKSLADICPVSTKSPLYSQCLKNLVFKFTNGANIIDNVNSNLTNLLNERISDRNKIVNSISRDMNPFIYSKNQNDFNGFMNDNNSIAKTPDDVYNLVGNYYNNRFNSEYNVGYANTVEGFDNSESRSVDPNIVDLFFGYYKPLAGQFLVINTININIAYDISDINDEYDETLYSSQSSQSLQSSYSPQSTQSTQPNQMKQNNIILAITDTDGFNLTANIDSITKFKNLPNAVILKISSINIVNNPSNKQILQQLLSILGVTELTYLILTYEEYTSTENVLHKTYKLVNENLDTIILLNKL
jgi:hypothetical protein